jgi:peptide/nickel transport system permease protein
VPTLEEITADGNSTESASEIVRARSHHAHRLRWLLHPATSQQFLASRTVQTALSIWVALTVVFAYWWRDLTAARAELEQMLSDEGSQALRGASPGVVESYFRFLGRALTGDQGESFAEQAPVTQVITHDLWQTVAVVAIAVVVAVTAGVFLWLLLTRGLPSWCAFAFVVAMGVAASACGLWLALDWTGRIPDELGRYELALLWKDPAPWAGEMPWPSIVRAGLFLGMLLGAYVVVRMHLAFRSMNRERALVAEKPRSECAEAADPPRLSLRRVWARSLAAPYGVNILLVLVVAWLLRYVDPTFFLSGLGQLFRDAHSTNDLPVYYGLLQVAAIAIPLAALGVDVIRLALDPAGTVAAAESFEAGGATEAATTAAAPAE